jgi:transposase
MAQPSSTPGSPTHIGGSRTLETVGVGPSRCPGCGRPSTSVHSTYHRRIRDLPMQAGRVILSARIRWFRCLNRRCRSVAFAERLDGVARPFARVTDQVQTLIDATGHMAGGLPDERLLRRVGVACSADTILRHLKRRAAVNRARRPVRVVGIDDWAARKGHNYGTIIVDLERWPRAGSGRDEIDRRIAGLAARPRRRQVRRAFRTRRNTATLRRTKAAL